MKKPWRIIRRLVLAVAILYILFVGFLWWAMHQSPEKFGKIMSWIPAPVTFQFFPFETLWVHARAGTLNEGDPAPDFSLFRVDKSGVVQLAELNKQRPVVLVFGSYT
jgi:hypothetical protein